MENISIRLLNLLLSGSESTEVSEKIFKILKSLREYNESFLHLILPSFCSILQDEASQSELVFLKEIVSYIESMLEYESSNFFNNNSFTIWILYNSFSYKLYDRKKRCTRSL